MFITCVRIYEFLGRDLVRNQNVTVSLNESLHVSIELKESGDTVVDINQSIVKELM